MLRIAYKKNCHGAGNRQKKSDENMTHSDREMVDEAMVFLNDLRGAGVFHITEMQRHLETTFFMQDWEAFIILHEWIRINYTQPNPRGKIK